MEQHTIPSATVHHSTDELTPESPAVITALALRAQVLELERQRAAEWTAARHRDYVIAEQVRTARREHDEWLRRHFMKTAEAAEALGVSPRLLQALAAQGSVTLPTTDGHVVEIGFRTVVHGGYWFARDDIHRTLRARRR